MSREAAGATLKKAREAKGLTQADVSQALGFTSPQFVSNAERGLANIPRKHYKKLAKMVGRQAVLAIIQEKLRKIESQHMKELDR